MKNTHLQQSSLIIIMLFILFFLPHISQAFISFPDKIDTLQERKNIQIVLNMVLSPSPNLKVDGVLGRVSIQTIQSFQESRGLVPDGKVGAITRLALESAQVSTPTTSYAQGCSPGAIFNTLNGQSCTTNNSSYPLGCLSNTGFNTITGLPCSSVPKPPSGGGGGGGGGGSSTDRTKPVVTDFTIPITSTSLTINITTFTSTDNKGVTGYLLTESSSAPSLINPDWSSSAPSTYTFTTEGAKTLYAWARDGAGNISDSVNDTINVVTSEANTYYIANGGSDTTGDGSIFNPWSSLYKACNSVTTSGQTIHVLAGTYVETQACNLAVGVNLEGDGVTSVIKSHYTTPNVQTLTTASISLVSSAVGSTNGNQSISDIKLDGDNLQGHAGILVRKRSNVKIHDITVVDFFKNGVAFWGPSTLDEGAGPFVYDTGNELYNAIITNCGDIPGQYDGHGQALIYIAAQKDMLIHDNILTENSRAQGHNGNIVNAGGRHFKNVKYYNNKSYKPDDEGPNLNPPGSASYIESGWNFHLEFWKVEGGIEIYGNEFHGGDCAIDIGGRWSLKGEYDYSFSIHDNLFTPISNTSRESYWSKDAIVVESYDTEDVLIYNNSFNYGWDAISVYPRTLDGLSVYNNTFNSVVGAVAVRDALDLPDIYATYNNINIYNNLIENLGYLTGSYYSGAIYISNSRTGSVTSNFNVYNNAIVSNQASHSNGVNIQMGGRSGNTPIAGGTLNNINIKNNIMAYLTNAGPLQILNNGAINGLHINNNLLYNLSNSNILPYFWPYNNGILTDYTPVYASSNNIPLTNNNQQNPLFVSSTDFHLQAGSPAIDAGVNVGLPYNGSAPDIGAFETGGILGVSKYNFTQNLKQGSINNEVKELQKILISNGYLKITTPINTFGPLTEKALKEYQKAHNLNPDGMVGLKTREVLNK